MKCSNCGNEFNGKFCTNCGTPAAPAVPTCSNCGHEATGKFCEKCGTPVSQPETAPAPVAEKKVQPVEAPATENVQTENPEPMQYTPAQNENPAPMQYNANQQFNTQPVQPSEPQQSQTSYGQQFTNHPNDGFTGQQFTNQPASNAPNGKKRMSTGKIIGLIIAGVATLFIIICIIIGVVIFKFVSNVQDNVGTYDDSYSYSFNYDDNLDDYSDIYSDDTYESSDDTSDDSNIVYEDSNLGNFDEASNCYYKYVDGGVEITEYEQPYNITSNILEVELPEKIDGKDVVEIEYVGVFDLYSQDVTIKVIVPGSVEIIRGYSFSFQDEIDEVIIEDGVEVIEENAFIGCEDLEKVTVPNSVINMDKCGLGLDLEDDYITTKKLDDFVMYGKKGSVAEEYCKTNGLKFVNK